MRRLQRGLSAANMFQDSKSLGRAMRDPLHWSLPIGRLFGVNFRVHVMLPLIILGLVLREVTKADAPPGTGAAVAAVIGLFLLSILVHEIGHIMAARLVGGDAEELVLWPLGGLTPCDVPHAPRATMIASCGGIGANLLLCLVSASVLMAHSVAPTWNPFSGTMPYQPELLDWSKGVPVAAAWYLPVMARLFWINWLLLLLNLVPAFPLDGAYILHAGLWSRGDYRESLANTAYVGFGAMLCLFVLAIFRENVLLFALVVITYLACRTQFVHGETGGDETSLGYDFSQGYSSLERGSAAPPRRPQPNFMQRWLQRRAARRALAEQRYREEEEQRMDDLLEKVQAHGLPALTDEERQFLSRVSARYRK